MQDLERRDPADRDWPGDPPDEAGPDPEVSTEHQPQRRWSTEQKAQIVRESFWLAREPGERGRTALRAQSQAVVGVAYPRAQGQARPAVLDGAGGRTGCGGVRA